MSYFEDVDILMATFNGEEYIETQIHSILSQKYKRWRLYISDDGSSDKTVEIIKKFSVMDSRIFFIKNDNKNIGPGARFLSLLKYSKSKFSIFCDQDDLWLENKIEELINFASKNFDNKKPSLVHCDGYIYEQLNCNINNKNIASIHANGIGDFIYYNGGYQGCSMLFNEALRDLAMQADFNNVYMHDHFLTLLAYTFGDVYFLDKKLMLYRIHDRNVCGLDLKEKKFVSKFLRFVRLSENVVNEKNMDLRKYVFKKYRGIMNCESENIYRSFFCSYENGKFSRIKNIFHTKFNNKKLKIKILIKTFLEKK